jgi:hypothetical protein
METATAQLVEEQTQMLNLGVTATQMPPDPKWNAVKHGMYSEAILLPGDDVEEFRRRHQALFLLYRPQTEDEAECVDTMAECRWRLKRCRPVQAAFDAQVSESATAAPGRLPEPHSHQRLHSAMDVTVHQQRIDRLLCRARSKLVELQKLRRQGLVDGALPLPSGCYMETSGDVVSVSPPLPAVAPQPAAVASDSRDERNRENSERTPRVTPSPSRPPTTRGRLIGGFGARRIYLDGDWSARQTGQQRST